MEKSYPSHVVGYKGSYRPSYSSLNDQKYSNFVAYEQDFRKPQKKVEEKDKPEEKKSKVEKIIMN